MGPIITYMAFMAATSDISYTNCRKESTNIISFLRYDILRVGCFFFPLAMPEEKEHSTQSVGFFNLWYCITKDSTKAIRLFSISHGIAHCCIQTLLFALKTV